jgi:hypothetical protein
MKRRIWMFAALAVLGALLSGCDKCGGLQEIRIPKLPDSCAGDSPR